MATGRLDEELATDVRNVDPPKDREGGTRSRSKTPRSALTETEAKELKRKIEKFLGEIVAPIIETVDEYDARIIRKKAGQIATAYSLAAKENPLVRRILLGIMESGGPMGAVLFVTLSTALPILHHHGTIQLPTQWGVFLVGEPLEEPKPQPAAEDAGTNGGTSAHESEAFVRQP